MFSRRSTTTMRTVISVFGGKLVTRSVCTSARSCVSNPARWPALRASSKTRCASLRSRHSARMTLSPARSSISITAPSSGSGKMCVASSGLSCTFANRWSITVRQQSPTMDVRTLISCSGSACSTPSTSATNPPSPRGSGALSGVMVGSIILSFD